jgi:hypothetical protein
MLRKQAEFAPQRDGHPLGSLRVAALVRECQPSVDDRCQEVQSLL